MFHCVRNTGKHINIQFLNTYSYIIRGLRARRRVVRRLILGDGFLGDGFLGEGFFRELLNPTPAPGTGRKTPKGFAVTFPVFFPDIPLLYSYIIHGTKLATLATWALRVRRRAPPAVAARYNSGMSPPTREPLLELIYCCATRSAILRIYSSK